MFQSGSWLRILKSLPPPYRAQDWLPCWVFSLWSTPRDALSAFPTLCNQPLPLLLPRLLGIKRSFHLQKEMEVGEEKEETQ